MDDQTERLMNGSTEATLRQTTYEKTDSNQD